MACCKQLLYLQAAAQQQPMYGAADPNAVADGQQAQPGAQGQDGQPAAAVQPAYQQPQPQVVAFDAQAPQQQPEQPEAPPAGAEYGQGAQRSGCCYGGLGAPSCNVLVSACTTLADCDLKLLVTSFVLYRTTRDVGCGQGVLRYTR